MDDTNIEIGNEDELFSIERHKKLKKLMPIWWNWIITRPYEGQVLGSSPSKGANFKRKMHKYYRSLTI